MQGETKPRQRFPDGYKPATADLVAGKYGTYEQIQLWGREKTFEFSLQVQGVAARVLSALHPDVVPPNLASEIYTKASLAFVSAERIIELERTGKHDVIAINTALEEVVSKQAAAHINKFKTSADTTQPAKALQMKQGLEVIAESIENLRDILIEKSVAWMRIPHMDCTHGYDAVPTFAGRPFSHYVEMLASDLKRIKYFHDNSIMGKWADVTGNHHSAKASGVDGIILQDVYCDNLGIGNMVAPAQIPGLEFEADIMFGLARTAETLNNIAKYIEWGRSDDVNIFVNARPGKQKGSSGMPHKTAKNGNPDIEEQMMSCRNYMAGALMTAMMNCEMPYARNLAASANSRINYEGSFKFLDHVIRNLADQAYWLNIRPARSEERVRRSFGVVTSERVMTYLTDHRKVDDPMTRNEAHELMGELATVAWDTKTQFAEVLLKNLEVMSLLDEKTVRVLADPLKFTGESERIIMHVKDKYYKQKTFA